jgi:hypothetical protein
LEAAIAKKDWGEIGKLVDIIPALVKGVPAARKLFQGVKPNGSAGQENRCSFCGRPQPQVQKLIAGPAVYICDSCVELCSEILAEELNNGGAKTVPGAASPAPPIPLPSPK